MFFQEHAKNISKAREEFEEKAKEMEAKYDKKFEELRVQLNTKHEWVALKTAMLVVIVVF